MYYAERNVAFNTVLLFLAIVGHAVSVLIFLGGRATIFVRKCRT